MFGKKAVKKGSLDEAAGYIGKGVYVEGLIKYDGALRIDGHFKGRVESKGFLTVGEGALIEGELDVEQALISGEVKGSIVAHTKVELRKPAHICGDITALTLVMGEGVVLEGNCVTMRGVKKVEEVKEKAEGAGEGEKK